MSANQLASIIDNMISHSIQRCMEEFDFGDNYGLSEVIADHVEHADLLSQDDVVETCIDLMKDPSNLIGTLRKTAEFLEHRTVLIKESSSKSREINALQAELATCRRLLAADGSKAALDA